MQEASLGGEGDCVVQRFHSLVSGPQVPWETRSGSISSVVKYSSPSTTPRVTAALAWLSWDCLGSSLLSSAPSLTMDPEEAVITAAIGLQLYTTVPEHPLYCSEMLRERGTVALARNRVPLQLVAGR